MTVDDILEVLKEYPPSSRLVLMNSGVTRRDSTVAEVISLLMSEPPDASLTIFGKRSFILRERIKMPKFDAIAPPQAMYLELDAR